MIIHKTLKRSEYLVAKSKIEQLKMELKLKDEALKMKEAAWKSKESFQTYTQETVTACNLQGVLP